MRSLRNTIFTFALLQFLLWTPAGPFGTPCARAAQVNLTWAPSPSSGVSGYRVHRGTASQSYEDSLDVGKVTNCTIPRLKKGVNYYFAITSYDGLGNESDFSAEVFYPGINIAPGAQVEASSQNLVRGQAAVKALDTVKSGYPADASKEWATLNELSGAWMTLAWPDLQEINRVVLYDRPNGYDQILAATLVFSDGSSVPVGVLADDGAGTHVTFPTKVTNGIALIIESARGTSTGLSEIEIFGCPM